MLRERDRALLQELLSHLAISPQLHAILTEKWAQTELLLEAARRDGRKRHAGFPHSCG